MDVAAKVLGMTAIVDPKSFPISYTLKYNPTDIQLGHTYSMSARITGADGQLRYINDVHTRAELTGGTSPVIDIAVIQGRRSEVRKVESFIDRSSQWAAVRQLLALSQARRKSARR